MSVNWTEVLTVGVPGYIAAIFAGVAGILAARNRRSLKTPSGTSIGRQVEDVLHTALANNYHLRSIGGTVAAPSSPEAQAQESNVEALPGGEEK